MTNPFTDQAAKFATEAQAFQGSTNPERHRLLVEAVGFATVGNAIDSAELLAITRAKGMEGAILQYALVPAENALDLGGLNDAERELLATIAAAALDAESTLRVIVYDDNTYDTERVAQAALLLKVDEERLAAFIGGEREYTITDTGADIFAEAAEDRAAPEPKVKSGKGKKSKGASA